jgi:drug/metabolite transporter (DMT)-like permease
MSRRLPLLGVVFTTQVFGMVVGLVIALLRGETMPMGSDLAWSVGAGLCGTVGMTSLYRGLAMGRMGVVAPTTGVVGAVVPVIVGFVTEGVPSALTIAGIATALLAVVLVTRAPGHQSDRPSGVEWALLAGLAIGGFNICVGQLSGAGQFGPLVVLRGVQAVILGGLILLWRRPWRVPRPDLGRLFGVGVLDMLGNVAFISAAQVGALAVATILSSLYPVTTVLLALTLLHERVTRSHIVGIALTVAAIALITVGTTA